MSSVNWPGSSVPAIGLGAVDAPGEAEAQPVSGAAAQLPPVLKRPVGEAYRPTLSEPAGMDPAALMSQLLSLTIKMGNEQQDASMQDAKFSSIEVKQRNQDIAKKMAEAIDKMASAKTWGTVAKVAGWVAVGLSVLFAAVTLGTGAIIGAAIAVGLQLASETGLLEKATKGLANTLQSAFGMSKAAAQGTAELIMAVLSIVACVVPVGLAVVASRAAQAAGKAVQSAAKSMIETAKEAINNFVKRLLSVLTNAAGRGSVQSSAQVVGDKLAQVLKYLMAATAASQSTGSGVGAVHSKLAKDIQADVSDDKAFIAKLQKMIEDETDRIQDLMQKSSESVSRAMRIISSHADTSEAISQFGNRAV